MLSICLAHISTQMVAVKIKIVLLIIISSFIILLLTMPYYKIINIIYDRFIKCLSTGKETSRMVINLFFFFIFPFVSSRLNFSTNSSNRQITHDVKHSEAL